MTERELFIRDPGVAVGGMRKQQHRKRVSGRTLASLIRGFFRTRQVYVRSRNDVHYVTFTPLAQLVLLALLLAGLFWTAFASINIVFKDQLLELKQQKLFEARLNHEHQLAAMRDAIERANDRLLLNQQAYLKKVDEVKTRFNELADRQKRMHDFFSRGWIPVKPVGPDIDANPAIEGNLDEELSRRYAAEFHAEAEGLAPLADMNNYLGSLHQQHLAMAAEGLEYANQKLAKGADLMTRLGIGIPELPVALPVANATGGPYLPAGSVLSQYETQFSEAVARIDDTLRHRESVMTAVEKFPLGMPLTQIARISSGYGYRTDPLRRTPALHGGVDFIAAYGAQVFTTSAGRIVWAGQHGPYGNLVEILHDNGVSTRYGHLRGVNVSLGQKVESGDVVGWLGNTGRSTGPHLHYETRVKDRAIDPQQFWRIRNDLQTLKDNNKQ